MSGTHDRVTHESARSHSNIFSRPASLGQVLRTHGIETSKESDHSPTTIDRRAKESLRKPKAPNWGNGAQQPELRITEARLSPRHRQAGQRKELGRKLKTSGGSHDTQNHPFFRATWAKLPSSPEDGGGCEPVCQLGGGELWRGYARQVSRGHYGRLVLPRPKETHTQARLAQARSAPRPLSNPSAKTNIRREKSTIPL